MKNFGKLIAASVIAATAAFSSAEKDIVDTAVGAGNFKTLVALVQQAGLVETLKGKGPFTVFAPTDAAFAKLPKDLVKKVTSDKKLLTTILTYHVVAGEVLSTSLKNGQRAKTVQGEQVRVGISGRTVRINNARVTTADIKTSNGVIHVIDTVIIPPSVLKALEAPKKKH
jgi:uncharacterized surface protein with fasciclin (FAS1) repeats